MKKFYFIAIAATTLAACTSNETLKEAFFEDNETVMIGFQTFHEKSTKTAPDPTGEISEAADFTSAHGGFGVWGFKGAPDDIVAASGNPATVDISNTTNFVPIFENVKVWYEDVDNAAYKPKGFTYTVPKYWDKKSEYIFFAYAPYNGTKSTVTTTADVASLDKTTGKITIRDIESIQDISKNNGGTGENLQYKGTGTTEDALAYLKTDATNAIDYLMAKYETEQKYAGTNQDAKTDYASGYTSPIDYRDQTVGFTFGHMLSRMIINLKALDQYKGVKSINVTYLAIVNMPESANDKTVFTQNSPTASAGTYNPSTWTGKTLQIINTNSTGDANANATSKSTLYILKGGLGKTSENVETTDASLMASITAPAFQNHSFYYYVAPNTADNASTTEETEKYWLNAEYDITYVDNTTEHVVIDPVDLSGKLTELLQNNSYTITIKIGLNQIYFNVDAVTPWTTVAEKEIEIQ